MLFLETIEFILLAEYAPKDQKSSIIKRASGKLDALKYFLQLTSEMSMLEHNQYIPIAVPLTEAGKMLGGWQKHIRQTAPAP
ncbi:MAG: hypothetical protein A3E36_04845 [Candidatus Andersenbacteria bacterium RIFCSPHIGHO2_12_FULL_45_11b]|uniref:Four helix bundle protein n=1 Tax=Candidatus Andersenbacteria bacterium RIFCSPHIGHO2_12_FULL_45_11b TaxID=1797282 RepID=A0A1G1XC98_9BACT|nr:MAG: hypothetical protein A3E36_04845 [Candidatus Andersenbacteria bacterium RIFCSPHIGHO2_12_FULL_45_11b]